MRILSQIESVAGSNDSISYVLSTYENKVNAEFSREIDRFMEKYQIDNVLRWKIVKWYCVHIFSNNLLKALLTLPNSFQSEMDSLPNPESKTFYIQHLLEKIVKMNDENNLLLQTQRKMGLEEDVLSQLNSSTISMLENDIKLDDGNPLSSGKAFSGDFLIVFTNKDTDANFGTLRRNIILKFENDDFILLARQKLKHFLLKLNSNIIQDFSFYYKLAFEDKLIEDSDSDNNDLEKNEKSKTYVSKKKRGGQTKSIPTETLEDLWDNEKLPFSKVIEELKKEQLHISSLSPENSCFIINQNGKDLWNRIPSGNNFSRFITTFLAEAYAKDYLVLSIKGKRVTGAMLKTIFINTFITDAPNYTFTDMDGEKKKILSKDYKSVFQFLKK
jgi:hypothetical protein